MEVQEPRNEDIKDKEMIEMAIKNFIEASRQHLLGWMPATQPISTNISVDRVR